MLTVVTALLLAPSARADELGAETCLHAKIWDGYSSGYQVRSQTNTTLGAGEHRVYLITLYAGNEYRFQSCGDDNVANIDLVLYDAQGNQIAADNTNDREPSLGFTPTATDTYYLAVHASKLNDTAQKAGVSTGVTYK